VGSTQPTPITGLAKVMTAHVLLQDHPLAPGAAGPAIPVIHLVTLGISERSAALIGLLVSAPKPGPLKELVVVQPAPTPWTL